MNVANADPNISNSPGGARISSIDALRGLTMFTMIFVNDIAGVPQKIVPWWMRHYPPNTNGMTFVDLVFPAFLFIVGMSIPLALGGRLSKGEPVWKAILHVATRVLSLLFIGILMVNETPDTEKMGWSGVLWVTLMYIGAIFAFCSITPRWLTRRSSTGAQIWRVISLVMRVLGFAALVYLAIVFVAKDGHRIITFKPFSVHTEWYGILGLIGWAYLVGALTFLCFRTRRTALLGCVVLLMCLYPADRTGVLRDFLVYVSDCISKGITSQFAKSVAEVLPAALDYVSVGEALGSQAAITVAGVLLATILLTRDTAALGARIRFTLLFVAGFAAAALLLHSLYGIDKNSATPSWCLWACAITGAIWLACHTLCDLCPGNWIAKPIAAAGENVLLAYLISEMLPSVIELLGLGVWYKHLAEPTLPCAIARSAGCAAIILLFSASLNRAGFRLKL
jgi:predicted acyltransferase